MSLTLKFWDKEYSTQSVTLNWKCNSKFYGHCLFLFCFWHPTLAGEIFHDWLKHYSYTRCTKTPFEIICKECPKLCGTFLPFHSHFTRYIRKEKCLLRNSLTVGIIYVFSSRPFLPNGLNVSGSNMWEISSVALPRVELRWNSFNLGTTHYCERRNYFKVSLCYRLILSPYHAMELLCPSFSALSSSSRNLYDEANMANS